jgi:WhiB family redox-sensing transcriptional regulator
VRFLLPPAWTRDALCAQVDPELFFPDKGGSDRAAKAKAICAKCPVRRECLEYALACESGAAGVRTSYPSGIYGGLSEHQRRRLRRNLKEAS